MERFDLKVRLYPNKRLALQLFEKNGESWGVLTTNLVDAQLAEDEICIPVWNLPESVVDGFLSTGKFEDTGRHEQAGFEDAPVWRVKCPDILAAAAQQRLSE